MRERVAVFFFWPSIDLVWLIGWLLLRLSADSHAWPEDELESSAALMLYAACWLTVQVANLDDFGVFPFWAGLLTVCPDVTDLVFFFLH